MFTSPSSLPACSACGSREVHVVHRPAGDRNVSLFQLPINDPRRYSADRTGALDTFFACRGCGRDVTDAWAPLQPRAIQ